MFKPITSEKAVRMIDMDNTLIFAVDRNVKKPMIKKEFESLFNVKVDSVRTHIRNNVKYAHIKLVKENPAVDVATKLGII
jgi:large subunit ribosomal protein L23